jgi:hypothetical protein
LYKGLRVLGGGTSRPPDSLSGLIYFSTNTLKSEI